MSKTVLTLDEINLLKNSEEIKNTELYGNLYSVICNLQNPKALSLEQMPDLNDEAKAALTYNKKTLIDTIIKEWYAERVSEEDPSKKVRCGLCNTPNKYLYYIRNRKNGTLLNVGSRCITKFPNLEGYVEQKQQLNLIHKNQKVVARRNEFYKHFQDCEGFISNADKYFSTLPVLLPYDLYSKLNQTVIRLRLIYSKYVDEGKKPFESKMDSFELFGLAMIQFNELKSQSDNFVQKNINNRLICKKREIDWLISENKEHILKQISENKGCYNLSTLKQIVSYPFVSDYTDDIFGRNQSQLFKFTKIDGESVQIAFTKFGYQPNIMFKMSLKDFMYEIGANCIFDPDYIYSLDNFYQKATIQNTKDNLESIMNYISTFVYSFNCALLFDESNNNLILCRRGDKAIRMFNHRDFMILYSRHINKSDDEIKKYIFSIVKGKGSVKWISKELQSKQGIDGKINKLYKEQYLDVKDQFVQYNKGKYVEVVTYRLIKCKDNNVMIDFDHPEYIKISRRQIRLSDNSIKRIEYAIYIPDDALSQVYSKGTMLFIQDGKTVRDGNQIFYVNLNNELSFETCHVMEGAGNIFEHIPLSRKNIKSYGRIMCSFVPKLTKDTN